MIAVADFPGMLWRCYAWNSPRSDGDPQAIDWMLGYLAVRKRDPCVVTEPDYILAALSSGLERAEPSHFADQPRGSINFLQFMLLCVVPWSAALPGVSWGAIGAEGRRA